MERSDIVERSIDTPEAATLAKLLAARYSCRAFLDRALDRAVIARIVEMAQLTASWCNSQAWQLIITDAAETERFRAALYAHSSESGAASTFDLSGPERYEGVYLERRRECGWALYRSVGVSRGDREASTRQALENFRLFGAPHVAIVTTPRSLGTYGAIDCGGFVANFLLAAQAFGVASVAQASIAAKAPFVRQHFGIPEDRLILCGISFGYADRAHGANAFRTTRADVEQVVQWVG